MRVFCVLGFAVALAGCDSAPKQLGRVESKPEVMTIADLRKAFDQNQVRAIAKLQSANVGIQFQVAAIVEERSCLSVAGYSGDNPEFIARFTFPKSKRDEVAAVSKGGVVTIAGTYETYEQDMVTFRDSRVIR